MKKTTYIFGLLACIVFLPSCQKVVDIDLNSASPKYVIEGSVTNTAEPCRLRITKTKNFSDDNNFEGVTTGFVTISDNAGNADTLFHTSGGVYESNSVTGVPGNTYYLQVKIADEVFTAISQMPVPVAMDTLFSADFPGFNDTLKMLYLAYADPAPVRNYFRYILSINNEVKNSIFIDSDEFNNGNYVLRNIFYQGSETDELNAGDSAKIEMQCIDGGVYNYFFTLNQTVSQSSAAPTNPISNITGGALGYFSANTIQRKTIQVQ